MIVETRLSAPANMESGVNVGFGPFHDLAQLIPVVYVGKIQILHRGTRDDHTVILPVLDLIKGGVEGGEVTGVGILRDMAESVQQLYLNLKRGVGEFTQQLGLRYDLGGHQI